MCSSRGCWRAGSRFRTSFRDGSIRGKGLPVKCAGDPPERDVRGLPSKSAGQLWFGAVLALAVICALAFVPARAFAEPGQGPLPQSTPQPEPAPEPDSDDEPVPQATSTPEPSVIQQVVRHTITFSTSSLIEAITEAFIELSRRSMDGAVSEVLPAMDSSLVFLTEVDHTGLAKFPQFEASVRSAWNSMLKVSLVFAPLVLALTVLGVLGGGGGAVEARAEVITHSLHVLISYAGAATSFYLLSLGIRASWGLTAFIWGADLGVHLEPAKVILGGVIASVSATFLGMQVPLFGIYLIFFFVFTVLALMGALGLALAATTALLAVGVIVAPLMIGLGSIPQFRWLTWTWTRLMMGLLLLPVLNAILLKVASLMHITMLGAVGEGGLGSALLSFFVVAGVLSLVIGINYKVGVLVFAPLLEVHRKALGATKTVAVLAAAGAALALGGPGVLKAGLGLVRPSGPGPGGPSGGSAAAVPGAGGAEAAGRSSPLAAPPALPPRAASAAMSTLAGMSANPVVRGALTAASRGFRQAANGRGGGPGGALSTADSLSTGGVYSVSMRDAARSVLGEKSTPGAVGRMASSPDFQRAMRRARRHAVGLERAGLPFDDQVREAGFPDREGYLAALGFQVAHKDLRAAVGSALPTGEPVSAAQSSGLGAPAVKPEDVMTSLSTRLDALGDGGFPGTAGNMRLLRRTGWWSFNPDPSDPRFHRYAQAFLRAGHYLSEAGAPDSLVNLERAVQSARGSLSRSPAPSEHMARIQEQILSGSFGPHQEMLAQIFEVGRG